MGYIFQVLKQAHIWKGLMPKELMKKGRLSGHHVHTPLTRSARRGMEAVIAPTLSVSSAS